MRKINGIMTALALLAMTLTGCGGKEQASAPKQNSETLAVEESQTVPASGETETKGSVDVQKESGAASDMEKESEMAGNGEVSSKKTLVVYYSASGW